MKNIKKYKKNIKNNLKKKLNKKMKKIEKIPYGFSYQYNGWKYIRIYGGNAYLRGKAYGTFCASDFRKIQEMLHFFIYETYGCTWKDMVEKINADFFSMTKNDYPEIFAEMQGIADGVGNSSVNEILAWNFYLSIPYWLKSSNPEHREGGGGSGSRDRCSAFMAVGKDWTVDGGIVVAHNSFSDFIDGQYMYVILDIWPESGYRMVMQTSPCWIWSGSDMFVTSRGIIGTETTIGGFLAYEKKVPIGYRIRTAMQYGRSLDEYVAILLNKNSGDYANSWLFGDIHSKEILRLELGLKYHKVDRTKNGYFIGFNAAYDPQIRQLECTNPGFFDIRRHQGARYVRLSDLMDTYKGKLNVAVAQKIIADHYDVYEKKINKCSRTVCSHYDLDAREYMSAPGRPGPFAPHGALDGMVCDSALARKMQLCARYGNSCGTPFKKDAFIKKHRQYEMFAPFLMDRPKHPWTIFPLSPSKTKKTKKNNRATMH